MEFPKLTTIVLATALSCVPHLNKHDKAITLPQATTRQAVQKTIKPTRKELGPGTCGLHGIPPLLCNEKGCRELPCE